MVLEPLDILHVQGPIAVRKGGQMRLSVAFGRQLHKRTGAQSQHQLLAPHRPGGRGDALRRQCAQPLA